MMNERRITEEELTTLEQHAKHNNDFTGVDMGGTTVRADVKLIRRTAPEIRKLREALKDYGRHKNRCGWIHYERCDCGLDDALADRKKGEGRMTPA